jgi:hypothetical protein
MTMGKEPTYTEPAKTPPPLISAKPLTEEEWEVTVDRLDATKEVFRQNREMRDVLSRREAETRALQTRNAKLEELMRKFAPILQNAATAMGLAARSEKPDTRAHS